MVGNLSIQILLYTFFVEFAILRAGKKYIETKFAIYHKKPMIY